jgi:hypothetical protein
VLALIDEELASLAYSDAVSINYLLKFQQLLQLGFYFNNLILGLMITIGEVNVVLDCIGILSKLTVKVSNS